MKDVALRAKVSIATASRVIGNHGYASAATRKRVLEAMKEFGYRPHGPARNLKRDTSSTIALLVTDIQNPFYSSVAQGVIESARNVDLRVAMFSTNEDAQLEREAIQVCMEERVAGLIAVPVDTESSQWSEASDFGIEIVYIDRPGPNGIAADTILVDNLSGSFDATSYLLDLGHVNIAIVTGPSDTTTGALRMTGYEKAFKERNMPVERQYTEAVSFTGEAAEEAMRRILSRKPRPTAVFAANNVIAEACLRIIRERELVIPRDISLIAFDDVHWMSLVDPGITAVYQPTSEIGHQAVAALCRRLREKSADGRSSGQSILLPTRLVLRKSCAKNLHRVAQRQKVSLREADDS